MQHQPFAFCGRGGQGTEIVTGGAEPAVHNQHVALFTALAQNSDQ